MEIKKCPFCGGEVEVDTISDKHGDYVLLGITCKKCDMFYTCSDTEWVYFYAGDTFIKQDENILIEAWNRRVDDGREEKG